MGIPIEDHHAVIDSVDDRLHARHPRGPKAGRGRRPRLNTRFVERYIKPHSSLTAPLGLNCKSRIRPNGIEIRLFRWAADGSFSCEVQ